MQKRIRIREFEDTGEIETLLLLSKKEVLKKKDGSLYLSLTFKDETGRIEGRMWDNVEESLSLEPGDVLRVKGEIRLYNGKRQLVVRHMRKEALDAKEFIPCSLKSPEELRAEIFSLIDEVQDPYLKALLKSIWEDEEIMGRALECPGGKRVHHTYKGGLVEHLISVAKVALQIWEIYQDLDRDLLIAGALLHDVGKIDELSWEEVEIDYTLKGRLLGHVVLGIEMVSKKMKDVALPKEKALKLLHIIASHHGEPEQGAIKKPKFKEAVVIHYLDQLDSKLSGFEEFIQSKDTEGPWAGYHKVFQRFILKG